VGFKILCAPGAISPAQSGKSIFPMKDIAKPAINGRYHRKQGQL
jgi:hypothetical protein